MNTTGERIRAEQEDAHFEVDTILKRLRDESMISSEDENEDAAPIPSRQQSLVRRSSSASTAGYPDDETDEDTDDEDDEEDLQTTIVGSLNGIEGETFVRSARPLQIACSMLRNVVLKVPTWPNV